MRPSTFATAAILVTSSVALAAPSWTSRSLSTQAEPIHLPLTRRSGTKTPQSFLRKAKALRRKYGKTGGDRLRSRNSVSMTNEEDSEFYASITVGTPAQSLNVVLDTGSSDLILATSPCQGCETTTPLYSPTDSSTSASTNEAFSITYGSGDASGTLASDTVTLAGYTISNQTFGACTDMNNIVIDKISGLLGMGWERIASSGATPLVQALAQAGSLPAEEFGFAFTTYSTNAFTSDTMAGGTLTIGGTDSSFYSGEINWIDIVTPAGYWSIPLQGLSVGGVDLSITADAVVVDSGTSLIGAPTAAVQAIYAQISGSQAVTLDGSSGYYSYPCSASPNVTFTFGGQDYSITSANFNSGYVDSAGKTCLGAIFDLEDSSIPWIVGDAFRFSSPAAVGFATRGSGGTSSSNSSSTTSSSSSASLSSTSGGASSIAGRPSLALAAGFALLVALW